MKDYINTVALKNKTFYTCDIAFVKTKTKLKLNKRYTQKAVWKAHFQSATFWEKPSLTN